MFSEAKLNIYKNLDYKPKTNPIEKHYTTSLRGSVVSYLYY
nr:MAG TPA: hypothetical protein [Caudoviricetes sp.]